MTKPIRILGRAVWIVLMTVISLLFAYPFLYSILGSLMLKEDFGNMGTLLPAAGHLQELCLCFLGRRRHSAAGELLAACGVVYADHGSDGHAVRLCAGALRIPR